MAMINCKECGAEISSKASACPKCGAAGKKPMMTGGNTGCGLVLLIIIVGAIFTSVADGCRERSEARARAQQLAAMTPEQREAAHKRHIAAVAQQVEKQRVQDAIYTCQNFVKQRLNDPDSALFTPDAQTAAGRKPDGQYFAVITGRAKNAFGGYVPMAWDCVLRGSGDGSRWTLTSLAERK
jgi:hypothetical protein